MLRTSPPHKVAELIHGPLNGQAPPAFTREVRRGIMREVLSMGLPSMTGFLVSSLYEIVNMFWLARIGSAPVAAITMGVTFIWVLSFWNMIIGTGSVATISRRFGEGDLLRTEQSIKNTFVLKFALGTLFGVPAIFILPWVLDFMNAAPDVKALGIRYATLQLCVLGFAACGYSVYTALRSIGQPRAALWIQALGTGVNCVIDPLLIFGIGPFPQLGILGASIATATAHITVVATGMWALQRAKSPVRVKWLHSPAPAWPEMWQQIRIGLPAGVNSMSFSLATSFAVKLVAAFGTTAVAAYGMSSKVMHFGVMAVAGLGLGTGALIGQYLGARQLDRAWLAGVLSTRLAFWIMIGYAAALLVLNNLVVSLFFSDPATHDLARQILRIMLISLPMIGLHIGAETVFEGAGQNTPPMILSIVHSWVMVIPFMYLFGTVLHFGPLGLMWGWTLAHALGGLAALWLFRRGTWLMHIV
jgi:putative MATE family efflux protein